MDLNLPDIEKMEKEGNIEDLIKAINHSDPNIRRKAIYSIRRLGDKQAIESIITALQDKIP